MKPTPDHCAHIAEFYARMLKERRAKRQPSLCVEVKAFKYAERAIGIY